MFLKNEKNCRGGHRPLLNSGGRHIAFALAEGAHRPLLNLNFGKAAFTLAEVLITLAIIGIVAALTIPTFNLKYNEKIWQTQNNVFARNISEALRLMNIEKNLNSYQTTEDFTTELNKYLKITQICTNTKLENCFTKEILWDGDQNVNISDIKTAKNFGKDDWGTNTVGIQLANGTSAVFAYNPNCTGEVTNTSSSNGDISFYSDCIAMVYDVSNSKAPNTYGKDIKTSNTESFGKIDEVCSYLTPEACTQAQCTGYFYERTEGDDLKGCIPQVMYYYGHWENGKCRMHTEYGGVS